METARLAPLFIIFLRSLIPFVKNVTIYGRQHFSCEKYIIPAGQARFLMVNTLTLAMATHWISQCKRRRSFIRFCGLLGKSIRLPQAFLSLLPNATVVPDFCLVKNNTIVQLSMFGCSRKTFSAYATIGIDGASAGRKVKNVYLAQAIHQARRVLPPRALSVCEHRNFALRMTCVKKRDPCHRARRAWSSMADLKKMSPHQWMTGRFDISELCNRHTLPWLIGVSGTRANSNLCNNVCVHFHFCSQRAAD